MGRLLKELAKWLIITAVIGSIAWISITVYKSLTNR